MSLCSLLEKMFVEHLAIIKRNSSRLKKLNDLLDSPLLWVYHDSFEELKNFSIGHKRVQFFFFDLLVKELYFYELTIKISNNSNTHG